MVMIVELLPATSIKVTTLTTQLMSMPSTTKRLALNPKINLKKYEHSCKVFF